MGFCAHADTSQADSPPKERAMKTYRVELVEYFDHGRPEDLVKEVKADDFSTFQGVLTFENSHKRPVATFGPAAWLTVQEVKVPAATSPSES
jgi:hypothetical protein